MIFSDFEKELIKTIVSQNGNDIKAFGFSGRKTLFPKNEGAVFMPGNALVGGQSIPVLFVLAFHGGTSYHAKMRNKMVTFVSLMRYLEDNRLIYVMDASVPIPGLYYSDYPHISLNRGILIDTRKLGGNKQQNTFEIDLDNGSKLIFKSTVEEGYITSYDKAYIQLPDGNHIGRIDFGGNIKSDLRKYLNSFIYPTKELAEMVGNDFKTESEIIAEASLEAAKTQVKKASQTLVIAILTLIFGIATPILSSSINNSASPVLEVILIIVCAFLLIACGSQLTLDEFHPSENKDQ